MSNRARFVISEGGRSGSERLLREEYLRFLACQHSPHDALQQGVRRLGADGAGHQYAYSRRCAHHMIQSPTSTTTTLTTISEVVTAIVSPNP